MIHLARFSVIPPFFLGEESVPVPTAIYPVATLLPNTTWQFTWDYTGPVKIVYYGRILAIINEGSYIFDYPGPYDKSPPPLEIIPTTLFADSELAKPYVTLQWYRDPDVTRYEVQKYAGSYWKTVFKIQNVNTQVFTYNSENFPDGSTHRYKIVAYNAYNVPTESTEYNFTIYCPPTVFEPTIDVDYDSSLQITFNQ